MLLALGLAAFLLASVFGLEISRPTSGYYTPAAVKDLRLAVEPANWTGEQTEAASQLAVYQVSELDSWRNGNGLKANALYRAIFAETAGIALVTAGILVVILLT